MFSDRFLSVRAHVLRKEGLRPYRLYNLRPFFASVRAHVLRKEGLRPVCFVSRTADKVGVRAHVLRKEGLRLLGLHSKKDLINKSERMF